MFRLLACFPMLPVRVKVSKSACVCVCVYLHIYIYIIYTTPPRESLPKQLPDQRNFDQPCTETIQSRERNPKHSSLYFVSCSVDPDVAGSCHGSRIAVPVTNAATRSIPTLRVGPTRKRDVLGFRRWPLGLSMSPMASDGAGCRFQGKDR